MMNILEFLKKGSGIHIKKENRGKFTSYCRGKVTSACIAKGKNSPNPAIRKRATFAANARKWKHLEGGVIKALLGWLANLGYKMGLGSKGDWRRMRLDLVDFGILLDNSDNPNQLIGAPTILPSKVSNKVVSSVAKVNDKGLPITKKFNSGVKSDATFLTGDNRFVNSGRKAIIKDLRERARYMITNSYPNTLWYKNILKLSKNRAKAESMGKDVKKYNQEINDILDDFIHNSGYFKKGGKAFVKGVNVLDSNPNAYKQVKKKYKMALEGTKLNFGLKVGNWINNNQGLISNIANLGVGIYSNIKLNKAIDLAILAKQKLNEVDAKKLWLNNYRLALGMQTDRSSVVNLFNANNIANQMNTNPGVDKDILELELSRPLIDWISSIGGITSEILNNKKSKTATNAAPSSTTSSSSSYKGSMLYTDPKTFFNS